MDVKLSSKDQMVLPKRARDLLGVRGGDRLRVALDGEARVIITRAPAGDVMALRGVVPATGSGTRALDAAIGDHLGEDDARIGRDWHDR